MLIAFFKKEQQQTPTTVIMDYNPVAITQLVQCIVCSPAIRIYHATRAYMVLYYGQKRGCISSVHKLYYADIGISVIYSKYLVDK